MVLSTPVKYELPFNPLERKAHKAVYDSLKLHRYNPETMIREEYSFSGRSGEPFKVNAVVFTHEAHRSPDYTGFTLFNTENGARDESSIVKILAQSAAPFHFIHRNQKKNFSFWFTNVKERNAKEPLAVKIESGVGYENLSQVLEAYSDDLIPGHINKVKLGGEEFVHHRFRKHGPFQLSIWAVDVTQDLLVKHFGRAVSNLREYHSPKNNTVLPKEDVTDIAVQLLGGCYPCSYRCTWRRTL